MYKSYTGRLKRALAIKNKALINVQVIWRHGKTITFNRNISEQRLIEIVEVGRACTAADTLPSIHNNDRRSGCKEELSMITMPCRITDHHKLTSGTISHSSKITSFYPCFFGGDKSSSFVIVIL